MKKKMMDFYMDVAIRTSALSSAKRLKVGSVLVKNDNIISFSWNGNARGLDNECEYKLYKPENEIITDWFDLNDKYPYSDQNGRYTLKTKETVTHAEEAMLMKMASSHESAEGATLFCTHACCMQCAKLIFGAKIKQFIYMNEYRSSDGPNFLEQMGIEVIRYVK
jgi:dCMP deaminase